MYRVFWGRPPRNAIHSAFSAENVNKTARFLIRTVKIDECIAFFTANLNETRYIARSLAKMLENSECFKSSSEDQRMYRAFARQTLRQPIRNHCSNENFKKTLWSNVLLQSHVWSQLVVQVVLIGFQWSIQFDWNWFSLKAKGPYFSAKSGCCCF